MAASDSDIEPPEFDGCSTAQVPLSSTSSGAAVRGKAASRPAPDAFKTPICIASYDGEWGHYDAATMLFWAGACAVPQPVADLTLLQDVVDPSVCVLPPGAHWPHAQSDVATAEYIDFSGQEQLLVQSTVSVDALRAACIDDPDVIVAAVAYEGDAEAILPSDWTLVTLRSSHDSMWVAQRLLFYGVCDAIELPDRSRPVVRTQCVNLHWIKDADVMSVLTRFADTLTPTRTATNLTCDTRPSLHRLMYDALEESADDGERLKPHELSLRRDNLNWSAFATQYIMTSGLCLSRRPEATAAVLARTFEPLASYAQALLCIYNVRAAEACDNSALCASSKAANMLPYNMPCKMTPAQITHMLQLYYWAVVHEDYVTARVSKRAARVGLELYLRFGAAVVKRRAYVFHSNSGKRRRAQV